MAYLLYFDPKFFEAPAGILQKKQGVFHGYNDVEELARLTRILEEDGIYKRPKLTLGQLATELNLPVKYTSYLIARLPVCIPSKSLLMKKQQHVRCFHKASGKARQISLVSWYLAMHTPATIPMVMRTRQYFGMNSSGSFAAIKHPTGSTTILP